MMSTASRTKRTAAMLLALVAALLVAAPPAVADGDPGSDVLVYQPLFAASDARISVADQVRLGDVLQATARGGFPVRVAIIATPDDLGAVGPLWRQPRAYARFLGLELSLTYHGALLVVMPDGLGFNWPGHSSAAAYRTLSRLSVSRGPAGLVAAAIAAVRALAAAHHVALSGASAAGKQARAGGTSAGQTTAPHASDTTRLLLLGLLVLTAAAIAAARVALRRPGVHSWLRRAAAGARGTLRPRRWLPPLAVWPVILAAVVLAVVLSRSGARSGSGSQSAALAHNPALDPGTTLSRQAPDFTLADESGQPVSLHSFRGKAILLAFTDSECTTLCPLATTAMLDAKAMLGRAGKHLQLLGVDANPAATSVEDVFSYSQLHGMLGAWRFLTGSRQALQRVWKAYSVGVEISRRLVDHTPAIFLIDPHGRLDKLYLTQQSYAAVPQLGQEMAGEISRLLPGHPSVDSHLSYTPVAGTSPGTAATLPAAGGGRVTLGPGRPHLLLFFATWDRQITALRAGVERLNDYQRNAVRTGLPRLTAVDEASVEPGGALASFLHGLSSPLGYPVALDRDGRLADGYEVQGLPWLVLTTASGRIAWSSSVTGDGWPTARGLARQVSAALARVPAPTSTATLAGSPPPLAALHRQAARLVGGGAALAARIRALRGYPIVLNVWAHWCGPCRAEFGLFAAAAARYGHQVAFLGVNYRDSAADARAFLAQHPVSYPSYSASSAALSRWAVVEGLPSTIYIDRSGKVAFVHTGQYDTQGSLDGDIQTYAAPS